MRDLSISVHFARSVLANTVTKGLDPIALLRKSRISPRLLLEDDARISIERYADLQVTTMLAMGDEALGFAAKPMPIGCWSIMSHAVIGSDNLGQALSRYCRFYQLFDYGAQPSLEKSGDEVSIRVIQRDTGGTIAPFACEIILFNVHRFASWLVQEHLPMRRVELSYPPAASPADYRHMFLGNPVVFEQESSRLVLSSSLLEMKVRQNQTSLRRFLRHPALNLLTQRYASDSWTNRVRDIIWTQLDDTPELNDVANLLALHPQTLRRRLSAEGTTFKQIKSHVRRDAALHYLGKRGLSIEDIAHRAGFSESSAFIRAFKGWTGVTPYTYRKGLEPD